MYGLNTIIDFKQHHSIEVAVKFKIYSRLWHGIPEIQATIFKLSTEEGTVYDQMGLHVPFGKNREGEKRDRQTEEERKMSVCVCVCVCERERGEREREE